MPTVLASGLSFLIRAICSATGFMSDVPVTLAPGASADATSLAATGSVTAVNRTGVSAMACAAACADGVAMASTRSRSAEANVVAIVVLVAASVWAFFSS